MVGNFGGQWLRSWTGPQAQQSWLISDLPRYCPNAYVYIYQDPGTFAKGFCEIIISHRLKTGRSDVPIIFLAHGLGGLLVKQVFLATSPAYTHAHMMTKFHECIHGFAFFGTPHTRDWAIDSVAQNIFRVTQDLPFGSEHSSILYRMLESVPWVNNEFLCRGGTHVPTVCFGESLATLVVSCPLAILLESHHADN